MNAVGSLLSEYRKRNHLSQLDLGLLAEVSPRHISFIETGKSQPSRDMLLKLADTLGLSLHESNLLLHSGGFSAPYSNLTLDDDRMLVIREALALMLEKQNPYPALVLDGDWNILMVNKAQRLMSSQLPMPPSDNRSTNLLELVFDENSFRPFIYNWEEVASHLLRRLRRQMIAYSRPGHISLFKKLLKMNPPADWQQPDHSELETPMLTPG